MILLDSTGQNLTAFEWVVVLGMASVIGFFLVRLINSIDHLKVSIDALNLKLITDYMTKEDHSKALEQFRREMALSSKAHHFGEGCPNTECPVRRTWVPTFGEEEDGS